LSCKELPRALRAICLAGVTHCGHAGNADSPPPEKADFPCNPASCPRKPASWGSQGAGTNPHSACVWRRHRANPNVHGQPLPVNSPLHSCDHALISGAADGGTKQPRTASSPYGRNSPIARAFGDRLKCFVVMFYGAYRGSLGQVQPGAGRNSRHPTNPFSNSPR
jgi:hypothetical protein